MAKKKYEIAVLKAEELNAAEKKEEWKGIVFIPYETKRSKCVTPCPYKEKTPAQKLNVHFKKVGLELGGKEDDCAKVGSQGCACCWYNCGHYCENYDILMCGKEAGLTLISKKNEENWSHIRDLKTPRKLCI